MKTEMERILKKEEAELQAFAGKELTTGGLTIVQKYTGHLKILGTKKVTPIIFHRGGTHKY